MPRIAPAVAGDELPYAAPLRQRLLRQMRQDRVPGALVYVDHPTRGIRSAALGSRDLTGAPLDLASSMRIGSVTKTLTATAVLQLVDQGLVGLDEPIETYLPGIVPNGGAITIRQLLNMTAGLFNNTEDLGQNEALDADPFQVFTLQESLAIAFNSQKNPYFDPGEGWHYSNTNYLVLGLLLEQKTGLPLSCLFAQEIFAPLGMGHSVMPALESAAIPSPHPRGYLFGTNVDSLKAYEALITGDTKGSIVRVPSGEPPQDATDWNPSYTWTAGSAISTLADMAI
jgi:D-alanyl-D-alanine carboxypeptidase